MHVSDGVFPGWFTGIGWVLAGAGVWLGLKELEGRKIVYSALLSAVFFVSSLIHIPVGITTVHPILNGLIGSLTNLSAFVVIFVGLFFQALFLHFGGITTIGINTVNMGLPAIVAGFVARKISKTGRRFLAGAIAGFLGVLGAGLLLTAELSFFGEGFKKTAYLVLVAHIPVMFAEAILTGFAYSRLSRSLLPVFLACLFFVPLDSHAHRVIGVAVYQNGTLQIRAMFGDGSPVKNGEYKVFQNDKLVASGSLNENGSAKVNLKLNDKATVEINAGAGHKVKVNVEGEFPKKLPQTSLKEVIAGVFGILLVFGVYGAFKNAF